MEDDSFVDRAKRHPVFAVLSLCAAAAVAAWALSRELYVKPRDEKIQDLKEKLEECRRGHEVPEAVSGAEKVGQVTGSKFDFESGVMGWHAQAAPDTMGCLGVKATAVRHYNGRQSLEMSLSMNAAHPAKTKGEAWVTIAKPDSAGREMPVNLKGHTISAWIYAPQGTYGPADSPNGVQLFVKDAHDRSLYGPWVHVAEEEWMELLLTVSDAAGPNQPIEAGFDPTEVKILGVKFGMGKDSNATYDGPLYVDHVNW